MPQRWPPPDLAPTATPVSHDDEGEVGILDHVTGRVTPSFVLMFASLPLVTGAYFGYRRALRRGDNIAGANEGMFNGFLSRKLNSNADSKQLASPSQVPYSGARVPSASVGTRSAATAALRGSTPPAVLAVKALTLGSMLSIGGFGLFSASVLYFSGSDTVGDFVDKCRRWTPSRRKQLEDFLGITTASKCKYDDDPDVKAVAGMNEEDEVEYYKRKYMPELYENHENGEE